MRRQLWEACDNVMTDRYEVLSTVRGGGEKRKKRRFREKDRGGQEVVRNVMRQVEGRVRQVEGGVNTGERRWGRATWGGEGRQTLKRVRDLGDGSSRLTGV